MSSKDKKKLLAKADKIVEDKTFGLKVSRARWAVSSAPRVCVFVCVRALTSCARACAPTTP